jgi:ribosomal protein S12 methylthiotransferase
MPTLHLISLGCTKNLVDSEVMLGRLRQYEITTDVARADVIIINTCGFIESAKTESIQTILSVHQQRHSDSLLIVTGCLTERYQEELQQELPEVDLFSGLGDFHRIDSIIQEKENQFTPNVFLIHQEDRIITGSQRHAYVKLSEGCNQRCSFCAIPTFKGKLQSRPIHSVIQEIRQLNQKGYDEITLIAQDTSSYLRDQGITHGLVQLIETLDTLPEIRRARILYLYPSTLSDQLIQAIASSSIVYNYFDMPIQHISESMLKHMRRGIGAKQHLKLLSTIRDLPHSFIRTSFIVGHPGECEEDFQAVCELVQSFPFDRINLFAYSDEENTHAYTMPNKVSPSTIETRLNILTKLTHDSLYASLDQEVGKKIEIYFNGKSQEHEYLLSARKSLWAPDIDGEILINESAITNLQTGHYYTAHITERTGTQLIGKIVSA